jgi:hypothetical protein
MPGSELAKVEDEYQRTVGSAVIPYQLREHQFRYNMTKQVQDLGSYISLQNIMVNTLLLLSKFNSLALVVNSNPEIYQFQF